MVTAKFEKVLILLPASLDLRKLLRDAYDISLPEGFKNVMAMKDGPLPEEEADQIVGTFEKDLVIPALDVQVLHGRSVCLTLHRQVDGGLAIENYWPSHEPKYLVALLREHGVTLCEGWKHAPTCTCGIHHA